MPHCLQALCNIRNILKHLHSHPTLTVQLKAYVGEVASINTRHPTKTNGLVCQGCST